MKREPSSNDREDIDIDITDNSGTVVGKNAGTITVTVDKRKYLLSFNNDVLQKLQDLNDPYEVLLSVLERHQQSGKEGGTKYKKLEGRDALKEKIAEYIDTAEKGICSCWLIGPAGAGKTHIGWDIACNSIYNGEEKFPCKYIYYFDGDALSTLRNILDNSPESIKVYGSTLFIIDYVYEYIDTIKELKKRLEVCGNINEKIAILYIERDSQMDEYGELSVGKKFYVNMGKEDENDYMIKDHELEKIMANILGKRYEKKEIREICQICVKQVIEKIDPIHRRPLFITILAHLIENEGDTFDPTHIKSIDALMERYWRSRRDKFSRKYGITSEEELEIKRRCEFFPMMIMICVSVLKHTIKITKSGNTNCLYDIAVENDRYVDGGYQAVSDFLQGKIRNMPHQFVADYFIPYLNEFCFGETNIIDRDEIEINAGPDLFSEWIMHKEIEKWIKFGITQDNWLRALTKVLQQHYYILFLTLIYRGVTDFPDIAFLAAYVFGFGAIEEEETLDAFCLAVPIFFKWELDSIKKQVSEKEREMGLEKMFKEISEVPIPEEHREEIQEMILKNILAKNDWDSYIASENDMAKLIREYYYQSKCAEFVQELIEEKTIHI